MTRFTRSRTVVAGLAGGLAELLWVMAYSSHARASSAEVARQITATLAPSLASSPFSVALGLIVHFALSVLLASAFCVAVGGLSKPLGRVATLSAAATVLAAVWGVNFFVVLPQLNPAFVALMPLGVTFISKLLFGFAMGGALGRAQARVHRARGLEDSGGRTAWPDTSGRCGSAFYRG
jgi:hypothetical protein